MDSSELLRLLEPLSPESACGPDLEYDPEFGEMERAAQGKPEQQFGETIVPAEEADWKDVQRRALGLLERTKDMRIVAHWARASLHLDGLNGFQQALALLRGYVEQYWDSVHPELDHDDNDDPTYRMNTLISLCDPDTTLRDLRETPLVASRALGHFSLRDIESATEAEQQPRAEPAQGAWTEEEPTQAEPSGPTPATINAAFSDVEVEALQATAEAVRQSIDHVATVERVVTDHVGASRAVSLLPLHGILTTMDRELSKQLERRGVGLVPTEEAVAEEHAGEEATGENGAVVPAKKLTGDITTRADAILALDKVCEYYERNEPSSPLPLLIRRAQRLASKSFLDIIRDLAPDAVAQAEALGGAAGGDESGYADTSGESQDSEGSSKW